MTRLPNVIALLSWFAGGILLGLIEVIALPSDPVYSTLLQLLPLLFLGVGVWVIVSQHQNVRARNDRASKRMKTIMGVGWLAIFGVDAGVASLNNMATEIFHMQLPCYYQGISAAQKIITLIGIFLLGVMSSLSSRKHQESGIALPSRHSLDPWERPLTDIGFIAVLLGVVLGLAQYWPPIVFTGFILLLAGILLYPIGKLTEKNFGSPEDEADTMM